jgi:hypothetical protein
MRTRPEERERSTHTGTGRERERERERGVDTYRDWEGERDRERQREAHITLYLSGQIIQPPINIRPVRCAVGKQAKVPIDILDLFQDAAQVLIRTTVNKIASQCRPSHSPSHASSLAAQAQQVSCRSRTFPQSSLKAHPVHHQQDIVITPCQYPKQSRTRASLTASLSMYRTFFSIDSRVKNMSYSTEHKSLTRRPFCITVSSHFGTYLGLLHMLSDIESRESSIKCRKSSLMNTNSQ